MIYQLEVEVPYSVGSEENTEIIPELSVLALRHGGFVNLNFEKSTQTTAGSFFHRQILNLEDPDGHLEERITELKGRFPSVVFRLKEQ
jgi:hypothetical protein